MAPLRLRLSADPSKLAEFDSEIGLQRARSWLRGAREGASGYEQGQSGQSAARVERPGYGHEPDDGYGSSYGST